MLDQKNTSALKALHPDATVPTTGGNRAVSAADQTLVWEAKVVSVSTFEPKYGPNGEIVKQGNGSILAEVYRMQGTVKDATGADVRGMLPITGKLVTLKCTLEQLAALKAAGLEKSSQAFFHFSAILQHDTSINANTGKPVDGFLREMGTPGEAGYRAAKPIHRVSGLAISLTEVKAKATPMSAAELLKPAATAPAAEVPATGDLAPEAAGAEHAEAVSA